MAKHKINRQIKRPPSELWQHCACVIFASGPSLGYNRYVDVQTVKAAGLKSIAVNTSWKIAPFCNVIYAGDFAWWRHNHRDININAERWTCSTRAAKLYDGKYRKRCVKEYNSGTNAIDVAANVFKSPMILLLGFDCSLARGIHHHGKHARTGNPDEKRVAQWRGQFLEVGNQCPHTRIINCSRHTELTCFEQMPLADALSLSSNL